MITSPGLIPTATYARSMASKLNAGDQPAQNVMADAILTAVNLGLFTADGSVSGYGAEDIQNVMNTLSNLGYGVSLSSTTLTATW